MPILILILIIVLVYLYFLLCRFLFLSVGPDFLFCVTLLSTAVGPLVYGNSVFRFFGQKGWRIAFLVPVVALLLLICIDFATIEAVFSQELVASQLARMSIPQLWTFSLNNPVNREPVLLLTRVMRLPESWWSPFVAGVVFKGALIVPFALIARGFGSGLKGEGQPAFLAYFHGEARRDLQSVARCALAGMNTSFEKIFRNLFHLTWGPQMGFIWPLVLMVLLALFIAAALGSAMTAAFLALHALSLGLAWAIAMFLSGLLFCAERSVIFVRSGYAKCPHSGCHAPVPLPVFRCTECGVEHDQLIPGRFGLLSRACQCGLRKLPTLFWLGKGQLSSFCPRCRKPMREELFGANVHLPVYGGPSTGKTMYMMAATWQLLRDDLPNVKGSLIEEAARRAYDQSWKAGFEAGRVREKTADRLPDAFLLSLRRDTGLPVSLYLYDPAGEALTSGADLEGHRFISYIDGLLLVIDPLTIPSLAERFREAGGPDVSATTSREDPDEVVHRVVNALENHARLSRRRGFGRRIAVVLTKADLPGIQEALGVRLSGKAPTANWDEAGKTQSATIRAWLGRNEPSLLALLETRFKAVRFFAVSSLGHQPSVGMPFRPAGVLPPLVWLLSTRQVLRTPRLAKIRGRFMEIAAVAAVILVFVAIPVWVAVRWLVPLMIRELGGS